MIPKKIHYVRVGGKELPDLAKKCIESWKKYLPDYELYLWNESNFDINSNQYAKYAYETKKYAFVSDYIRIRALYKYGGIYMDTDVEVIKNLDGFLNSKGFSGFESKDCIQTGIMASEKGNQFIGDILDWYKKNSFNPNNLVTNVTIITNIAKNKYGFKGGKNKLVTLGDDIYEIYPENYFCPKLNRNRCLKDKKCYTIHHFAGSWTNQTEFKRKLVRFCTKILKFFGLYSFALDISKKIHSKKN